VDGVRGQGFIKGQARAEEPKERGREAAMGVRLALVLNRVEADRLVHGPVPEVRPHAVARLVSSIKPR
jgi:hypothetical protein